MTHLTVDGAVAYARGDEVDVHFSRDGGETWWPLSLANDVPFPDHVAESLEAPRPSPVAACAPSAPSMCYRTAPAGRIEHSADGGRSWSAAWTLPRPDFVRRRGASYGVSFAPGPFDLIVMPDAAGHRVIAALGSEGVVVRAADGAWTRWRVASASPTPTRAANVLDALDVTTTPLLLAILLSPAVGWALQRPSGRRPWLWPLLLTLAAALAFLAISWRWVLLVLPIVAPTVLATSVLAVLRDGLRAIAGPAGVFLAMWLPFLLWAYGILPSHTVAVAAAAVGTALALAGARAAGAPNGSQRVEGSATGPR